MHFRRYRMWSFSLWTVSMMDDGVRGGWGAKNSVSDDGRRV